MKRQSPVPASPLVNSVTLVKMSMPITKSQQEDVRIKRWDARPNAMQAHCETKTGRGSPKLVWYPFMRFTTNRLALGAGLFAHAQT